MRKFAAVTPHYDILTILGPTASGKTALAAALADRIGGEVISSFHTHPLDFRPNIPFKYGRHGLHSPMR